MSWKESKVRLFPPQVLSGTQGGDRKPDIQDLFLLASQATLRNTTLSVSDTTSTSTAQDAVTPSTSATPLPFVTLPLHPVKVEPGPHVINLPPVPLPSSSNSQLISSSYNDCAIMPPPPMPPPKPRPSNSPGVSSTSEEHEIQAAVTAATTASQSSGQPALGKTLLFYAWDHIQGSRIERNQVIKNHQKPSIYLLLKT